MITSKIYVNKIINDGDIVIIEDENGKLPAFLVDYEDGRKYIILIPRSYTFSFEESQIQFVLEQYYWNTVFNKWGKIDIGIFTDSLIFIGNNVKVNALTGEWMSSLTEEELETAIPQGEYDFWFNNLGKTAVLPPLLNAIEKRYLN